MRVHPILHGLLATSLAFGCERSSRPAGQPKGPPATASSRPTTRPAPAPAVALPLGEFAYTGYHRGVAVVEGILEISATQTVGACGQWQLKRVPELQTPPDDGWAPLDLGPQVGTGSLYLTASAPQVVLSTTMIADGEVILVVDQSREAEFSGLWQYANVAGPVADGRFVARRMK